MPGFDAAQAAFDGAVPPYLEDEEAVELDCDRCGNQGVCPDCDPRRPWED
jgi:hypothetical protein